jgi:hypothetical protein
MDFEAKMNDALHHDSQIDTLSQHLTAVAQGFARVAKLQARLFAIDLRTLRNRVAGALCIWLVALCLFVAALPVGLSGLALFFADFVGIRAEAGLLWVAFATVALVFGLCAWGWLLLRKQWTPLNRSCHELDKTLQAIAQSISDQTDPRR